MKQLIGPNKEFTHDKKQNPLKQEKPWVFIDVKVATLTKGELIGYSDVVNKTNYTTSVKCMSSPGKILVISSNEFVNKMHKDR